MKAIRIHEHGGPEVLKYEDVPVPEPGPGEVRVKIAAVGVNFIDIYYRKGQYKGNLPLIIGREAGGVVDAVGPGVQEVHAGERVAYPLEKDSYAEYAVVNASGVIPVPQAVSFEQAVAAMVQGMTAHYLALSTYPLKTGDTALVHAAAGGTGALLVQVAKLRGARVIGTVGTEEKMALAREAGADHVINYTQTDFEQEVKRLTDGQGVDVVYDSVGKDTFDKSLNTLKKRGYLVLFGQSSGPVAPVDPQVLNAKGSLFLTRPFMGHYIQTREELLWRANEVFEWIADGKLKIRIAKTFPLAQAAEAQEFLAGRKTTGKILLAP
jgi:NADPH2:quinone reductase